MIKNKSNFDRKEQKVLRFFFQLHLRREQFLENVPKTILSTTQLNKKKSHHSDLANIRMRNEGRFMYKINQGHLNSILHCFCLTGGSTLTSQDYDPSSVVCVSKRVMAIWRYLLSEFCALLCCSLSQLNKLKKQCQMAVVE